MTRVWYVYPIWHKVSFTLIAEHHIRELKKQVYVYTIDEKALPILSPYTKPLLILHPLFYPMVKYSDKIERLLHRVRGIIGVDVADSDHISNLAVSITNYTEAVIVPSSWARDAYLRSGCRVPVHVVPHGLDEEWYTLPPVIQSFSDLARLKEEKKLTYLLYFCWHSGYRKGLDLVIEAYKKLRKERKDIVLIAKFMAKDGLPHQVIKNLGGVVITGWLSEEQKMELYDLADIYLGFSRGGAFELNFLEALGRGEVIVAAKGGPWEDYLPSFSLVKSRRCKYVLKDNPIHCGGGVEIDVKKAISKICEIVDNMDDYKARVREHVEKNVRERFTWECVGKKLVNIIKKYL